MEKDMFDGLLALKLVAEKKNFTAAASDLAVSPSALSQTIKSLESRLGVALLNRTTRSTSLTEAGDKFLAQAGPAMEQIIVALTNVGSYAKKPSGLLRLNLPRAIYPNFLEPLIMSFSKKYPDIGIELFFEDQVSDVVESGFDAGIRLSDILAKDMVAVKLFGPVRFVTAASPKYLNKMGRPKHPKELLSHNCVRTRFGRGNLYDRWEFESKGLEFQVQVKGTFIFNDSNIAKEAAIAGAGVIYTTEDSIDNLVKNRKLEIILNQFAPSSTGFYLYYPQRSQMLPKLRAFVDHIKAKSAENRFSSI